MRLLSISNINPQQTKFKGLWGDTKHIKDIRFTEHVVDFLDYTESEYYPFNDETREQMTNVKKEHDTYKICEEKPGKIKSMKNFIHTGNYVKIVYELSFSAKEWAMYLSKQLKSPTIMSRIESSLKQFNLDKYLLR